MNEIALDENLDKRVIKGTIKKIFFFSVLNALVALGDTKSGYVALSAHFAFVAEEDFIAWSL